MVSTPHPLPTPAAHAMMNPLKDLDRADIVAKVFNELDWATDVDAHRIAIHFREGVVTLTGVVANELSRIAARDAAFRVPEVRTIDDQVAVGASASDPANTEISLRVERALAASGIARGQLRAEVRDHIVTISGRVDWGYERDAACRCVEDLLGVRYVVNRLHLVKRPSPDVTMGLIRAELARNALVDADIIHVSILDSDITLTGLVQSAIESQEAEHAAWSSPHVSSVHNLLTVRPL